MPKLYKVLFFTFFFISLFSASPGISAVKVVESKLSGVDEILKSGKVLGRVFFKLKDSELDEEAKKVLNGVAKELSGLKRQFIVRVEGYSDSSLEKKSGIQLSIQRAQAVKLYMSGNFPELKVDVYITGFGETRPVVPESGVSAEEMRKQDRRVDLVAYAGANFFEEPKAMKVVRKIKGKKTSPSPFVVVKVVKKGVSKKAADSPFVMVSVIRRKMELVISALSLKRFILPGEFFDDEDLLKNEARPVLENILREVRGDYRWIFVDAAEGQRERQRGGMPDVGHKKQILMAQELIDNQGINPDRLFVKGIDSAAPFPGDVSGNKGEVYLYIPMQ